MPQTCVHCSTIYEDNAPETIKGCAKCGSRFFFHTSQDKVDKIKQAKIVSQELTLEDKEQVEQDVREIAGIEDEQAPIVLDFEAVRVLRPGKYMLDLTRLFQRVNPLVIKLDDGKYFIDLTTNSKK